MAQNNNNAQNIESNDSNVNPSIISLAPRDNNTGESQSLYEARLMTALQDKDIKNIALTGIYGSGKSTILNTFKNNFAECWNFADVSLSTFDTKNKEDLDSDDLQLIERSILQQLFYSVSYDVIPLSRFKRIVKTSEKSKLYLFSLIAVAFVSYFLVFSENEKLLSIMPNWEFIPYFTISTLLISSLTIIYKLLSYAINLKEIKLKLHDAEFNIKDEEDKSILNDHIDEIIYFFQETKKNVVIIEDLDRFDNTTIFVRLRELNSLINASCEHRIVFIYAIKDDMFTGTERSKFFEYIIPVIPIINPTNAYDLIKKSYKDIVDGIDIRFLRNTCLYFNDMRLVKNILNEYQDYTKHLKGLRLDKNQLFAMIVYKNYYPKEFARLNSNQGEIHEIFNERKTKLIRSKTNRIREEIGNLEDKKVAVENETLSTIEELNLVYTGFLNRLLLGRSSNVSSIKISNHIVNINNYNEEFFINISENKDSEIQFKTVNDYQYHGSGVSFTDVEKLTGSELDYFERLEAIKNKEPKHFKKINDKINNLKKQLSFVKNQTMEMLLQEGQELEAPEQLIFFILNGYINENYTDYISLFFESSISKSDKEYAMIVNGRQEPKFELKLGHKDELLTSYLSADEMLTNSALNIDILRYLLEVNKFEKHRQKFIHKICDKSDTSVEFLTFLFNEKFDALGKLVPKLAKYDNTVFDEVLNDVEDNQTVRNYSKIIKYIDSDLEKNSYLARKLSNFLSKRADYIDFLKNNLIHGKASFQDFSLKVQPKFKSLEASDLELFNWLGQQGFFSIDVDIINDILVSNLELSKEEIRNKLSIEPITTICNSNVNYLVEDFWRNIDDYIHLLTTYLEDEKQLHENESIFIELLNTENLSLENKERLLLVVATEIADIGLVEEKLYNKLLKYNVIKPSWENVSKYFEVKDCKLTERLIDFIDINAHLLNVSRTKYIQAISSSEELQKKLEAELVKSNDLSDTSYQNIVKTLMIKWNRIDFTGLNESKVLTLIANNKLSLTKENLEYITAYGMSNVRKAFMEYHILSFIDGKIIEELEATDYVSILVSNTINKAQKQSFIEKNVSKIIEVAKTSILKIIDIFDDKKLPNELYEYIKNNSVSSIVFQLLLIQNNYLNSEEVLSLLPKMDAPFNELNERELTRFEASEKHKEMLDLLHEKRVIIKPEKVKMAFSRFFYDTRLRKGLQ